jgi:hypothetical protein
MGSTTKFLHQRPMARTGPPGGDSQARASESDVNRMTGESKTHGTPYHGRTIHHEKVGDHRQGANFHSGSATSSTVDRTSPGRATHNGRNNGLDR